MRSAYLIALSFIFFITSISAQEYPNYWKLVQEADLSPGLLKSIEHLPANSSIYELNFQALMAHFLLKREKTPISEDLIINVGFPLISGEIKPYKLHESTSLNSVLKNKYPKIMSFTGNLKSDQSTKIKLHTYNSSLRGTIRLPNNDLWKFYRLDGEKDFYVFFEASEMMETTYDCFNDELLSTVEPLKSEFSGMKIADDGFIRQYRLALTTTAEYSDFVLQYLGVDPGESQPVKTAAVLSELNAMVAYLNSIYERELAISFELVAGNDAIIFFDTATDGLTHNNRSLLFSENQAVQDALILSANYDIGHLLDNANFGGIGEIASVCQPITKARGVTSAVNIDEAFYLLFAHEIGHQLGANHTFNNCKVSIPATSGGSSVEPGSGSTIMAYPGSCDSSNNMQSFRDTYFNQFNLQEIWAAVLSSGSCATLLPISNNKPLINSPLPDYTIPASTSFVLDISATDADADNLTYTWEQQDAELVSAPPIPTLTEGPVFRSQPPTSSSKRYFPEMGTILSGSLSNTWEVLPSVARTMNFAVTVRDNNPSGGQLASDETLITIDGASGPFQITAPASFEIWDTGQQQTIQWDVANTDQAPVNCTNVDILLSLDGGESFPLTLATATPNDGSYEITVPENLTLFGRIMIQCSDNIFFDVSAEVEISTDGLPTKTLIPDPSFENALRHLGLDNDGSTNNGTVITRDIVDLTELNIADTDLPAGFNTISDLTGIEDFNSLIYLQCFNNQISTMDLSQNTSLQILLCRDNNLTSLDLSQNTGLTQLNCIRNDLTYLDVRNGNNALIQAFDARINPELNCIDVDDAFQANMGSATYGSWLVDSGVHYSENCAASTFIPDSNFEQYLIDNTIDSDGILNKNVLNSDIAGITSLIIPGLGISDLTGIEGFTNLNVLSAELNSINAIDLSNNLDLTSLILSDNALDAIDLSANLNLIEANLSGNNLSELDLHTNTNLIALLVNDNNLEQLDLSLNDSLIIVECRNNDLNVFDMKNGSNTSMALFDTTGNPELYCILVDDALYSETNWTSIDTQTRFSDSDCNSRMQMKVLLQGPSLNAGTPGLMNDNLRASGYLPLTSPYVDAMVTSVNVFNQGGSSGTGLAQDDIVDWVYIELRDKADNGTILAYRSALLQRDGDVVDIDGLSELDFDLWADRFYITIQHRIHLGIMTNIPQVLNFDAVSINLADGSVPAFGTHAEVELGSGDMALWTGDADNSGSSRFSGANNDTNVIKDYILADPGNGFNSVTYSSTGYLNIDLNMDGTGRFSGSNNDSNIIKDNVLAHPGNGFNSSTYVIQGTIPPITN